MKYIVFKDQNSTEHAVLFTDIITHREMAKRMQHVFSRDCRLHVEPVSAGFYNMLDNRCFGKSESLMLDSRSEDDLIVTRGTL